MSNVFVLDTNKQPLDPVHPGWARLLLASGKTALIGGLFGLRKRDHLNLIMGFTASIMVDLVSYFSVA